MLHYYMLIMVIMFGHITRCSLLKNRKLREKVDLLQAMLKLEKKYRHEEFELLVTKLNEIDAKLQHGLINSDATTERIQDRDYSPLKALQAMHNNLLQAAFREEKEENWKYLQHVEEIKQALDSLINLVSDNLSQCQMVPNNAQVDETGNVLDRTMNETMISLESPKDTKEAVHVSDEMNANKEMSNFCSEFDNYMFWNGRGRTYSSCKQLLCDGYNKSGVYRIYRRWNLSGINVYCDQETANGGWTVFQRRKDGSVSFYRNWSDYKTGFGDMEGEFWLGNGLISQLLDRGDYELRIDLKDFEGNTAYAAYDKFYIGPESCGYSLEVSNYSGTAGDSLSYHSRMKFSTADRDNDYWERGDSCAKKFNGCWWYKGCYHSNLNGVYHAKPDDCDGDGLVWSDWKGFRKSVKFVEMKFRSNSNNT